MRLEAISQVRPRPSIATISLKTTYLNFCLNLPGVNELIITKPTNLLSITYYYASESGTSY